METLTKGYDVVTGRVTGVVLPYDPRPGYNGVPPETAPPDHPKHDAYTPSPEEIARSPGRLYTVYSLEVIDPGSTVFAAGETISVARSGGVFEAVVYRTKDDSPLEVGSTYILTIAPEEVISEQVGGRGFSTGTPFSIFVVEDGKVSPLNETWADMPAVRELTGKSPESAMQSLLSARAAASLEGSPVLIQ